MRKLLMLALFAISAHGAITSAQTPVVSNANCGAATGTTCQVTVTATAALNVGNLCTATLTSQTLTPSGGGTWVQVVTNFLGTSSLYYNCWVNPSLTAGVTTISVPVASNTGRNIAYEEAHSSFSNPAWIVDGVGTSFQSSCQNCTGAAVTVTGSNDVIFAPSYVLSPFVSINGAYVAATCRVSGVCSSYALNTVVGTAPTWSYSGTAATGTFTSAAVSESRKVRRSN